MNYEDLAFKPELTWEEFWGKYGSDEFEDVVFVNIGEHRWLEFWENGEVKVHSPKVAITIAENKTPAQMQAIITALWGE